jgi:transcriptional regulator with AAA-type ATPase domain
MITRTITFRKIERLEENLLHQFERGAEGLENFYFRLVPIHVGIPNLRDRLIKLTFGAGD